MTPMIDMVFLLLIFFVMTFNFVEPEGDFNIKMPPKGTTNIVLENTVIPLRISLSADRQGRLSGITLAEAPVQNLATLRERVKLIAQNNPDIEIELNPDEGLHYEHIIEAMTAVSGEIRNGQVHKICDKIKFAPRKS